MSTPRLEGGRRVLGLPVAASRPDAPLITVITVVFNDADHLESTILSVLGQSYGHVEYIVVDGGSTDGTLEVLKKHDDAITHWISAPDQGIYDAMNKGIGLARGDVIGCLNVRDHYTKDALAIVARNMTRHPEVDYFCGAVMKGQLRSGIRPHQIHWNFNFHTCHSVGFFIRKQAQDRVGLYSLKYKCSADYDFFYRMLVKHGLKGMAGRPDELLGHFDQNGYSARLSYIEHLFEETRIRLDNGQSRWLVLLIFVARYIRNRSRLA